MTINKLILTALCFFCICHTYAQNEKLIVEGPIVISGNEDPNPVPGTIRWTGQDFEGFDGTRWKSLTCGCDESSCLDSRFIKHTVLDLTQASIRLMVETAQNMPLRIRYYPSSNPSQEQFLKCEPTATYGAKGNEHIQNISELTASTEYTIIFQSSLNAGTSTADCPTLNWEDISCETLITTLPAVSNNCFTTPGSTEVIGLPYLTWSLNNQKMVDNKKSVAWSFKAERTETFTELVLNHRVGSNYSSGNGGTLKYKFYEGALPNLGNLIFESGIIVAHIDLYGNRPANTVQPGRNAGNQSYQPFPVQVSVIAGQLYTIVVERQTSSADYISINGFIIDDETRDYLYDDLGEKDPIEWKIYNQAASSSNWVRDINNIALFSLGRSDGTSYGNLYADELAGPQTDRLYNLSGSDRFRWNLNLSSAMDLQKIGIGLVRRSGTEPVILDIKNATGTTLSSHIFDFSNLPIPGQNNTNLADNDWLLRHGRIVSLDVNTCLPAGQLFFEVRTGSNTNFEIAGIRDGTEGYFLPAAIDNGYMEISTNGGAIWSKPQQWSNTNVEMVQPVFYIYGNLE